MYKYIFKYLNDIIDGKSLLVYGDILVDELEVLYNSKQKISIVNDNIESLVNLKSKFSDLQYNQSLYFIKEKFDFLLILSDAPISPKNYINNLGIYVNVEFIKTQEDYHRIVLSDDKKGFEFLQRVNLYKKDTTISLIDGKNIKLLNNNLFSEVPDVIIEFYSDFKLDLENIARVNN